MDELKKKGSFQMEITFDVDVEYSYEEGNGEIELTHTMAKMENYRKEIDIFPYLPVVVVSEIDEAIMENIQQRNKNEGN